MLPPTGSSAFRHRHKCYYQLLQSLQPAATCLQDQLLTKSFAYPGHQGAVKCITAGGKFVVSGGADDQLHIYDVQAQKDLGFLMNPGEGPVTAVELYAPAETGVATHLFSGGADGTLAVWSAGPAWDCLKVMTGHHKEITALSVHPSGKLALSTSRDSTLRIWDLIKGRCSYHNNLPAVAEGVTFSPDGTLYALLTGSQVTIHNIGQEEGLVATLQHPQRVLSMAWCTSNVLLTGTEAGSIHVWNTQSGQEVGSQKQAHKTRIRGLVVHHADSQSHLEGASAESGQLVAEHALPLQAAQQMMIASAASDGSVKTWHIDLQGGGNCLQSSAEYMTSARLTCMCLVQPTKSVDETVKAVAAMKAKRRKAAALVKQTQPVALDQARARVRKPKKQVKAAEPSAQPDITKVGVVRDGVVDFTSDPSKAGTKQHRAGSNQSVQKRTPKRKH